MIRSCWTVDYKKRPQASEIVEFIANNPRLLTPCLDVPLSSVQMEDNGQFDLLPEKLRKFSMSLRNRASIVRSQNQNCASTQWVMKPTERGTPAVWSQVCGVGVDVYVLYLIIWSLDICLILFLCFHFYINCAALLKTVLSFPK